jgi:hypothetical protein
MALPVEEDEALDPADVGLLGAEAVVARADGRADAVEEARLAWLASDRRGDCNDFGHCPTSQPAGPILWALAMVHDSDEPDTHGVEPVHEAEWESSQRFPSNEVSKPRRCSRILDDRPEGCFDLCQKREPQAREPFLII